jgi:hypothetical protein
MNQNTRRVIVYVLCIVATILGFAYGDKVFPSNPGIGRMLILAVAVGVAMAFLNKDKNGNGRGRK